MLSYSAGLRWSIPVQNLRPLLTALERDIKTWILQKSPKYAHNGEPVKFNGKSYAFKEYFVQNKIDPKLDTRYSKYFSNQRRTIAGSYVWADSDLSEFADELEKPIHAEKLCWIDVLINCQFALASSEESSGQVVGLTSEIYSDCDVLILLTPSIFTRAWCLLEAANYTRNGCKIYVVGQCSFLQGEDYLSAMTAGVASDVDLITSEIKTMFGADYRTKFNRAIDDAVVQVYGESLLYNGRFQEAVPVFEKELELKQKRGDDEGSIASTYIQLGRASDSLGKYAEALAYYEKALQRNVRCFGTGHVSVAGTYGNIANVQLAQGKFSEALETFQKVLDIFQRALGPHHVSVAMTKENIAIVHKQLGHRDLARTLYQEAHEIFEKALGPLHHNTKKAAQGLAELDGPAAMTPA